MLRNNVLLYDMGIRVLFSGQLLKEFHHRLVQEVRPRTCDSRY